MAHSLFLTHILNPLSSIMIALTAYIGICVASFSWRYMRGDKKYVSFFLHLSLLIASVLMMVTSDDLRTLFLFCCLSNFILVRLMTHKASWKAAKASGNLTATYYLFSALCMAIAFSVLHSITGEIRISSILEKADHGMATTIALTLLLLAAMTQSALWPFHRWLLSSLNSPTPVSAIMHAGIINSGGFLLVRFAPLYLQHQTLMTSIFIIGLISSLLGTLWKLIQTDIKRMLACSTLAQMGFMFVQCGLGLFPLAVSHLVWHGMFKAYLFLSSGGAGQEKRIALDQAPKLNHFFAALVCGAFSCFAFAFASHKPIFSHNSMIVLMSVAFIAGTQLALTLLTQVSIKKLCYSIIVTSVAAFAYGTNVYFIAHIMTPMEIFKPQALNVFHVIGIFTLFATWLIYLFGKNFIKTKFLQTLSHYLYVKALNASQANTSTITSYRNEYNYD